MHVAGLSPGVVYLSRQLKFQEANHYLLFSVVAFYLLTLSFLARKPVFVNSVLFPL